jgi:hypothetical protein
MKARAALTQSAPIASVLALFPTDPGVLPV